MKKRKILSTILFITLFLCLFQIVAGVLQRKDSSREYKEFYQNKEKIDVLFMGSSHVLYSILPMELWREYGIASYNMGEAQSTIPEVFWTLKNSLDYQSPKLVVVDLYNLEQNEKVLESKYLHNYLDTLPLSSKKVRMVYDLLGEGHRAEFLFPFSLYHNRWSQLETEDFAKQKSVEKGADTTVMEIFPTDAPDTAIAKTDYERLSTTGTEYLKRIVDLCNEKDIRLLFIYMPYGQADETVLMRSNYGYVLSEQYGVPFINFMYESGLINYSIDCCDANSHLNPAGSKKVTLALGAFIKNYYDIPDRRQDPKYQEWETDAQKYLVQKTHRLQTASELDRYLMLINDKQFSCEVEIPDSVALGETTSELVAALLENGKIKTLPDSADVRIRVTLRETNQEIDNVTFRDDGNGFYKVTD